jgi:hypothetical protein
MFPQQLISRFGGINLPPQKPNFKAVDFFLWIYLKVKVYKTRPDNILEFKKRIQGCTEAILNDLSQLVMTSANINSRVQR